MEENKIEEVVEEHNQLLTENMQETVQELTEIENKESKGKILDLFKNISLF